MEDHASFTGDIHRHCFTCIKVWKCTVRPREGESCLITSCPQNCGLRYHSCKQPEHALICGNEKEACINVAYGCPAVLQRKLRAAHLETCPASIVICMAEWNRWPLNTTERKSVPFAQVNPQPQDNQLDMALALRDQRLVNHWNRLPHRVQKSLRSDITPKHPALPLLAPYWNTLSSSRASSLTPRQSVERSEASVSSTDDESPWGRRKKPPGLLKSVFCELYQRAYPEESDEDTLSDVSEEFEGDQASGQAVYSDNPTSVAEDSLTLDISMQCFPSYKSKPKSMYTFICAHMFRRDEYPWHYLNVHSDIHGGLDGWMEQRCPLSRYGCPYSRRRLHPISQDARVVYCTLVENFGVDLKVNPATQSDTPSLADLPFEVLRTIARYLDAFTLSRLSLTCRLMRSVCLSLLDNRGLVTLQWKKVQQPGGAAHWAVDCKRWFFSSSFTPVKKWVYSDAEHVSNHLSKCPFNIKSQLPEKVPLLALTKDTRINGRYAGEI